MNNLITPTTITFKKDASPSRRWAASSMPTVCRTDFVQPDHPPYRGNNAAQLGIRLPPRCIRVSQLLFQACIPSFLRAQLHSKFGETGSSSVECQLELTFLFLETAFVMSTLPQELFVFLQFEVVLLVQHPTLSVCDGHVSAEVLLTVFNVGNLQIIIEKLSYKINSKKRNNVVYWLLQIPKVPTDS